MAIDIERLQRVSTHLMDVIEDPSYWSRFLEDVTEAAGAMGAGLLPDTGSDGALATASLRDCLDAYVREGWSERDRKTRLRAVDMQRRGQVATDRDLICDDPEASFLDDFLPRFDGKWWAGVGFRSGSDLWSLTLHRSVHQEPFRRDEKALLVQFAQRLTEVGGLVSLGGRITLSKVTRSFDQLGKAVVAIDGTGRVIAVNAAAEELLGRSLRITGGRLVFADRTATAEYEQMVIDRLRTTRDGEALGAAPIVLRRHNAPALLIRTLPVDGAARQPFLHARALLLIEEVVRPKRSDWQIFSRAFGLTPGEARLAAGLATGASLESVAGTLGIARETARNRVKSVFQKTDTHRQADLVALLASLT